VWSWGTALPKTTTPPRDVVDISWSLDRLVAEGGPDELAAWQQLPALIAKLDRFAALVASFGPGGDFALCDPPDGGVHNHMLGLRSEALWLTDGDVWQASDAFIARIADWRTSPFLRMNPTLNSVAEAKERYRAVCEDAFNAMHASRGETGRLTANGYVPDAKPKNPYTLSEAAAS
jgi:hypothetical protein